MKFPLPSSRLIKRAMAAVFLSILCVTGVSGQEAGRIKGELIIQLRSGASPDKVEAAFRESAGILPEFRIRREISGIMRAWLCSLDESAMDYREAIQLLLKIPGVQNAQVNHAIELRETTPDDPFFSQQWHLKEDGDHDIDADLAWDITTGGQTAFGDDIVVCVIEPLGAKWSHPDLVDNHWFNPHEIPDNLTDDDGNGYVDDYHGWNIINDSDAIGEGSHGTQVSSMIGAKGNNNLGISGVNWDVDIMLVQMGNVSEARAIEAYTYPLVMRKLYNETAGARGAFVVATNSSWGTDNGNPSNAPLWCAMYDSLGYYGVISCGATTNNNSNVDVVGDLPTGCPSEYLIAVTATDINDDRANTGYGLQSVDLGSPGKNVYLASTGTYANASGTSFACPGVAGAVALLYSAPCPPFMADVQTDPAAAALLVRGHILDGVDPAPLLAGECATGGRLNVYNGLYSLINDCDQDVCVPPFSIAITRVDNTDDYMVSWSQFDSMNSFSLRYRPEGTLSWTSVSNITTDSFTLSELLLCTTYEIQLRSLCQSGLSSWSSSRYFLTRGCCENPGNIEITQVSPTSVQLSWENMEGTTFNDISIEGAGISQSEENITDGNHAFYDLIPCSEYSLTLLSYCTTSPVSAEISLTALTGGCSSCDAIEYCAIQGDADYEWIEKVVVNDLSNESGSDGGYGDFTGVTVSLSAGDTYTITCTPGYTGFSYTEYFRAWIDYNTDGVFSEDEVIFDPGHGTTSEESGEFTVPAWVSSGYTRLRVAMNYYNPTGSSNIPVPCGDISEGEAEDYCVLIDNEVGIAENEANAFRIYPNPASDKVWIDVLLQGVLSVLDPGGRMVFRERVDEAKSVPIEHLPAGMYFISFRTTDGNRITSKLIIH